MGDSQTIMGDSRTKMGNLQTVLGNLRQKWEMHFYAKLGLQNATIFFSKKLKIFFR